MKNELKAFKIGSTQYYYKNEIFQMIYEGVGFVLFLASLCSFLYILSI